MAITRTPVNHPLEDAFGIDEGSTFNPLVEREEDDQLMAVPEQSVSKPYQDDAEDKEINSQLKDIYDAAMDAYDNQMNMVETLEPRYAARNAEVAERFLTTALNAVSVKARVKNDKRKSSAFVPFNNGVTNNNLVVASREDILKMMEDKK